MSSSLDPGAYDSTYGKTKKTKQHAKTTMAARLRLRPAAMRGGGVGRRATLEVLGLDKLLTAGHTLTPAQLLHVRALAKHYRAKTADRARRAAAEAEALAEFPFASPTATDDRHGDRHGSDASFESGSTASSSSSSSSLPTSRKPSSGGASGDYGGSKSSSSSSKRSSRSIVLEAAAEEKLLATLMRFEAGAGANEEANRSRRDSWQHRNSLRSNDLSAAPRPPVPRSSSSSTIRSTGRVAVMDVSVEVAGDDDGDYDAFVLSRSRSVWFSSGDDDNDDHAIDDGASEESAAAGGMADAPRPVRLGRKTGRASSNTRGLQALGGFAVGDRVTWFKADEDIPVGAVGLVVGFVAASARAKCRFPAPSRLRSSPSRLSSSTSLRCGSGRPGGGRAGRWEGRWCFRHPV